MRRVLYRSERDDYAPLDYQAVGSVAEGQRRREAEAREQGEGKAVERRRIQPDRRVDAYGTHSRRSHVIASDGRRERETAWSPLPGGPPVRGIAYPRGYRQEDAGTGSGRAIPPSFAQRLRENREPSDEAAPSGGGLSPPHRLSQRGEAPLAPEAYPNRISQRDAAPLAPEAYLSRANQRGEVPLAPEAYLSRANQRDEVPEAPEAPEVPEAPERLSVPMEGEFTPPVAPEIPEWLRVAKQNHVPGQIRPPRPRVVQAPVPEMSEPEAAAWRSSDPLSRDPSGGRREIPAIPRITADYEAAGYPPALLREQAIRDQALEAEAYDRGRHGAAWAVPQRHAPEGRRAQHVRQANQGAGERGVRHPRRQADAPGAYAAPAPGLYEQPNPNPYGQPVPNPCGHPGSPFPPDMPGHPPQSDGEGSYAGTGYSVAYEAAPRQGTGQAQAEPGETGPGAALVGFLRRVPWLGVAVAVLALAAVLLWILQMSYTGRTEETLLARDRAQAALAEAHPLKYRELIETQAQVYNLHPAFIAAIVLNESSFRPDAESRVGARGLMQLMPDTAEWLHGKIGETADFDFDRMYDAETNVRYACWYLNYLSKEFWGDPILVAAGFHAGQTEVRQWQNNPLYSTDNQTILLEDMMDGPTKTYVTKVLKAYAAYKRLYYEDTGA